MWQTAPTIAITPAQRRTLESWVRAPSTPQSIATRARIILLAGEGISNHEIARRTNASRPTVLLWRRRFEGGGPVALTMIEAGRGRKTSISVEKERQIVEATLHTRPKGATHWSCRTMAEKQGVSKSTINRVWQSHSLQPHRIKTFKLSRDPKFFEKLTDVVGLYLNPPEKALVLCVDEKSQMHRRLPGGDGGLSAA